MNMSLTPTRDAGLFQLAAFLPRAGRDYAETRNFERPDCTARISPWLRHRLITEAEVVSAVAARHGTNAGGKFIQEVFWRSYWKGWLELRPGVWNAYRTGVRAALNRVQSESGLRADFEAACLGQTGIACFDHWARELADTGFLHNHARMWFASIWIFTLRLPWALGADLFLRLLIDGDAASNTLSWRWVAGLQTRGKPYLATADNIARFTNGRFNPVGQLAENAASLEGPEHPERRELPASVAPISGVRTGLLLHDEDLSLDGGTWEGETRAAPDGQMAENPTRFAEGDPSDRAVAFGGCPSFLPGGRTGQFLARYGLASQGTVATLNASANRSPLSVSSDVRDFASGALEDAASRIHMDVRPVTTATEIAGWAAAHDLQQIVTPHAPVGPAADILADPALSHLHIARTRTVWDSACWPHATHGFFRFRRELPGLIDRLVTR